MTMIPDKFFKKTIQNLVQRPEDETMHKVKPERDKHKVFIAKNEKCPAPHVHFKFHGYNKT